MNHQRITNTGEHIVADQKANSTESQDEEDCWDDAREEQHQLNNVSEEQRNSINIRNDNNQLSSSSAYSSIQSNSCFIDSSSLANTNLFEANSDSIHLILHEAVFNNDANKIYAILKNKELAKNIINKRDKHGNTPLHLACMLGRSKEIVSVLLQYGAAIDTKNLSRWTPFHEACSYGNRDVISLMTKRLNDDVLDVIKKNELSEKLEKTKNYRLVLRWEFQSWVPFLSRVLPSDVCVITKQGKFIRIDTKLLDLEMLSWKRADTCLIYSNKFEKKWIIMNNKARKYQNFGAQIFDTKNLEEKVDEVMSVDIMDFELKSSDIQLTRSTCGWIWKADKMEKIGKCNAALYNFNNVFLVTRKRREHLSEGDLKRNKIAYKGALHLLKFGKKPTLKDLDEASSQEYDVDEDLNNDLIDGQEDDSETVEHRHSLSPPPQTNVTWLQYCLAEPGNYPTLGREQKLKVVKTAFKASVAMSDEFPISKNEFLDLLSIVPLKHFKKLKEFIEMKLPDGFPIRVDIPLLPILTARITFEDFNFIEGPVDESLFSIPSGYEEDPNLFPLLSGKSRNSNANT